MSSSSKPVALVTGASSGIGHAIAHAFAARGYSVFGTSRRASAEGRADGVVMLPMDVADDRSVPEGVATVLDRTGRIDVLVNNAGTGIVGGALESSLRQAKMLFDTNFFGAIRAIQAVTPTMLRQEHGIIVNISSVLGFLPAPYMALYAASKHAMNGYSQSLDHELRDRGVRVVAVEPAYTATSFDKNAIAVDMPDAAYDRGRAALKQVLVDVMATAAPPEQVAQTVLQAVDGAGRRLLLPSGRQAKTLALLNRFAPARMVDGAIRRQARL